MTALRRSMMYVTAASALVLFVALASGTGQAAPTEVPKVTNLRTTPSTFCGKRTSKCTNPGTTVRFTVSTGAIVTGDVWPRFQNLKGYKEFRRHFNAGANSIRLNDSRLTKGRWTLKLQGMNSVGSGTTANFDFHIVK
jgi:hypothetical protein